jgi:hypothetical protein
MNMMRLPELSKATGESSSQVLKTNVREGFGGDSA